MFIGLLAVILVGRRITRQVHYRDGMRPKELFSFVLR